VIDRGSTFAYKGKPTRVQQVGRELGVKYVLAGSARKEADRVRINVQLVDASIGTQVWTERYDAISAETAALIAVSNTRPGCNNNGFRASL
jgi:adenylate cyclase